MLFPGVSRVQVAAFQGLLALAIGLVVVNLQMRTVIYEMTSWAMRLDKGSEAASKLGKPPVPVYQRVYVFNLTNPREFLHGILPNVEELGPYVFRVEAEKTMTWADDRLRYRARKTFFYEPSLSNGSLSDLVTTVDPVVLAIVALWPRDSEKVLGHRTLLHQKRVCELLYDGYNDPLIDVNDTDLPTNEGRIGFLVGTNGTEELELEVLTGYGPGRRAEINVIDAINGSRTNPFYGEKECNEIKGTNGEMFPPFDSRDANRPSEVTFFNPQLCRPWTLRYVSDKNLDGLSVARFVGGGDLLSGTGNADLDECYEIEPTKVAGTFNAMACSHFLQVILSQPHFLHGDPELRDNITGLQPDAEKHQFFLDVYPIVGFVVNAAARIQMNFKLRRGPNDGPVMKEVIYPVLWLETVVLDDDRARITGPLCERLVLVPTAVAAITLVVAVASFVGGGWLLVKTIKEARQAARASQQSAASRPPLRPAAAGTHRGKEGISTQQVPEKGGFRQEECDLDDDGNFRISAL